MSPAEELRAAAARLRCKHSFPVQPPYGSLFAPGPCAVCGMPWGASVDVDDRLREPLAALFEHYAAKYERLGETFGHPVTKPGERLAEGKPQLHVDFALGIARVILGAPAPPAPVASSDPPEATQDGV